MEIVTRKKMGRPSQPNRVKVFSNRAMIYLNGSLGGGRFALCSLEDVENLKQYRWVLSASVRGGQLREGYASAYSPILRKRILMHKLIMGSSPGQVIDHVNNITLDNRRSNLRFVGNDFNIFRTPKWGDDVGVSFDKSRSRWEAYISKGDRKVHIGRFKTKQEAIEARKRGEIERFGILKPRGE